MPITKPTAGIRELVPLLFVQDIQRSVVFYRDQLGFELAGKGEPDGKLAWCRLQREGSALMLQQACKEDGPPAGRGRGIVFYFNCDDANAIHAEFTGRGLRLDPPRDAYYDMRQVEMKDPDGYALCFQSRINRS